MVKKKKKKKFSVFLFNHVFKLRFFFWSTVRYLYIWINHMCNSYSASPSCRDLIHMKKLQWFNQRRVFLIDSMDKVIHMVICIPLIYQINIFQLREINHMTSSLENTWSKWLLKNPSEMGATSVCRLVPLH